MIDWYNKYKELPLPQCSSNKDVSLSAFEVASGLQVWIGKDCLSRPSLIIKADAIGMPHPQIAIDNLSVIHNAKCAIHTDSYSICSEGFSLLICTSQDVELHEYFFVITSSVIEILRGPVTIDALNNIILHLIKLFRTLPLAAKKTIQGLWAELFVIANSRDTSFAIDAWHSFPDEPFDFGFNNIRLEIKSTSMGIRKHRFNLSQLRLNPPLRGFVVSIFVERFGNGSSINDLMQNIRQRISQSALIKLDEVVYSTLGNSWKSVTTDRFDLEIAKKTLTLFFAESLPCILMPLPREISDVHLMVDISNTKACETSDLVGTGKMLSLLPKAYFHS